MNGGEPLDHEWIRAELDRRSVSIGRPLRYESRVGSTNDLARDLAEGGAPHGTTVVADEQIAGRGRRGATRWQTPAHASIAMSVLLRSGDVDPMHLGRLGLCVAVAVAEAIDRSTGVPVEVKWPNDLVVVASDNSFRSTRKLGGILLEPAVIASAPARVSFIVIGIGINANLASASMAPVDSDALQPVALIDRIGRAVSREHLIVDVLGSVGDAAHGWSGEAWPSWRSRYEARMAWRGVRVRSDHVDGAGGRLSGWVAGVDAAGALVLERGDGTSYAVSSGRVRPWSETQDHADE